MPYLYCYYRIMKKLNFLIVFFVTLFLLTGCQTIKKKTDAIVEKENEKLSKYIGKSSNELRLDLGKPDEDYKNEKGNFELVYKTKKYTIPGIILVREDLKLIQNLLLLDLSLMVCF